MSQIKLLTKDTDLTKVEMYLLDWDIVVNKEEYKCFHIPGYVHTIGGRYGENDYWACPRKEEPSFESLVEFDGEAPRYSIFIKENNYLKTKWDETEIRHSVSCHILRNDQEFYCFTCREAPYAWAKAYQLIKSTIREGVINFGKYRYAESEIIGRHIWWKRQPYTLCTYMEGQCCAMAVPGHIEMPYDVYASDNIESVKLDLLEDKNIGWFCADY